MSELLALYAPSTWFLAVWVATPLLLIAVAYRGLAHVDAPTVPAVAVTRVDVVAIVALAVFFCVYALAIAYGEDLVGPDYAQLTAQRFFSMPIWPVNRRFFPLGLQEYNFLGLIGKNAQLYHTFSIYELLVVLPAIVVLLAPAALWFRLAVSAFVLTVPSIATSFFGLIYPERDIIFWMAIWLVAFTVHGRTGRRSSFIVALIAAQWMLYYKEIVFLLVAAFAAGKMVLDARNDRRDFVRRHLLELSHLVLCAVFLGVYFYAMRSATSASYAINAGRPGASFAALQFYTRWDPLVVVLAFVIALRLVLVLAGKRVADPMWDPLAVGALIYVLAYVKLAMIKDYYSAPADFVVVLYLARLTFTELKVQSRVMQVAAAAVVAVAFASNARAEIAGVRLRKEYVAANRGMVDALQRVQRDTLQLFFPRVGGFQLMEFSAYLRYRGFYLPGDPVDRQPGQTVAIVKGPHLYPDGRCQSFQYFRCEYAVDHRPDDLVVYLPGPPVSASDSRKLGELLFHFAPDDADHPTFSYVFRP